eukprot:1144640-Pelagomonas_calceolata.AAC.8
MLSCQCWKVEEVVSTVYRGMLIVLDGKGRKGKFCIAVPACKGSLAEAKMVPVTKPVRPGEQ